MRKKIAELLGYIGGRRRGVMVTDAGGRPMVQQATTDADVVRGDGTIGTPPPAEPTAHASTHENGGSDEINVAGLSGRLADEQTADVTGSLALDSTGAAELSGDAASPGNSKYYGTDGSGNKGFHALPSGGGDIVLIEEQNPSGVTAITFSSLGSYTHLCIRYQGRGDASATSVALQLTVNSDSGSNYDRENGTHNGSTTAAGESLGNTFGVIGQMSAANAATGNAGGGIIDFFDYRNTSFHKVMRSHVTWKTGNGTGGTLEQILGVHWRSTAAITSITLTCSSGNFASGSKFSLYGIN